MKNEPGNNSSDHNQGQEDAGSNDWNPPYSLVDRIVDELNPFTSSDDIHTEESRNDDYRDGWANHKEQTKSSWW